MVKIVSYVSTYYYYSTTADSDEAEVYNKAKVCRSHYLKKKFAGYIDNRYF